MGYTRDEMRASTICILVILLVIGSWPAYGQELVAREEVSDDNLAGGKPISQICQMFNYKRYFRAYNMSQFIAFGHSAQAGDMVELYPGTYFLGDGIADPKDPAHGWNEDGGSNGGTPHLPKIASDGTIFNMIGTEDDPIIFCGNQRKTIIDGADSKKYKPCGLSIVNSQHIIVAGFTVKNVLKGVDIQKTTDSEFSYITTTNTLQEGIRLRYNSSRNTVKKCSVSYTGLYYAGTGEGMYIGTSVTNSVNLGLPEDHSDNNIITENTFGLGVTAENIDVKEYTTGGKILKNQFEGKSISGVNSAVSWVVVKGNKWTISDNIGRNLKKDRVGYRIEKRVEGQGFYNEITGNVCEKLDSGAICIYIDTRARGNKVGCENKVRSSGKVRVCNCNTRCIRRRSYADLLFTTRGYGVSEINLPSDDVELYRWD